MECPWCRSSNCQLVKQVRTKRIHGVKLKLLGFRITENVQYWICPNCGYRVKANN